MTRSLQSEPAVLVDAPDRRAPERLSTRMTPERRRRITLGLLLLPAILIIIGLVLVPLALVVRNSFANEDIYGGITGGFTWSNYSSLAEPVYLKVLWYTVKVSAMNTAICVLAGYLVAYYMSTRPPQRQLMIMLLIVVPFWTDFLVRTFALINVLSPDGPLNKLTNALGITHGQTSLVPSQTATFIGLLYAFLPTAVFPIYASMRSIDISLREAAADLGCGWWRVHSRVYLPMCRQGLLAAASLVFIPTFGVYVIPVLLGGGKKELVGNMIVTLYTEFRDEPMGAAASVLLLLLMLVTLALVAVLSARGRKARS